MLRNLIGKKSQDLHFGEVTVYKGDSLSAYMIEKIIGFGPFTQIGLYLENKTSSSTQLQFDHYTLISNRAQEILDEISVLYFQEYNAVLLQEYELEFITLNQDLPEWEISFVRKGGFENCVAEYSGMELTGIYFSA